ncbi:hypothetical protein L873DRAFT_1453963 [Choiromyces venosus 120613-1]|uniref:Uncharacterized protein n=1 Tax=Choiromyces venosus 120613-1 TaxID=1336337 RepID=A0A3N4K1L6_9PEZI|nr:hypothetical protein L873DRAFT_1453963 [Choiromyces venosus 120613-1]
MLFMNIELFSEPTPQNPEARKKLTCMARSIAPPIDIHKLSRSPISAVHFVMTNWWIGLITLPRIVFQAAQLAKKKLQTYTTPTILPQNISRAASALEAWLEHYFRGYIQQRLSEYPDPILIRYTSARIRPVSYFVQF